jgi:RES domain-containing protein
MRLWRLAKASRSHDSLDDEAEGAKRIGGRWNSRGTPVVYAAPHVSTAAMEVLVHVDWQFAPTHVLIAIDVPENASVLKLEEKQLPDDWSIYPAPGRLAEIGDNWVTKGESLLLDVPSAASPYERNILINPKHPDATRCTMTIIGSYIFDGRLKSKKQ